MQGHFKGTRDLPEGGGREPLVILTPAPTLRRGCWRGPGGARGPRTWVWIILCLQSVLAWRKPLPQTLHTKGLAPVWTGM